MIPEIKYSKLKLLWKKGQNIVINEKYHIKDMIGKTGVVETIGEHYVDLKLDDYEGVVFSIPINEIDEKPEPNKEEKK